MDKRIDWTSRVLGSTLTGHPTIAAIRHGEGGLLELQLSGPTGYVHLDDAALADLTRFLGECVTAVWAEAGRMALGAVEVHGGLAAPVRGG